MIFLQARESPVLEPRPSMLLKIKPMMEKPSQTILNQELALLTLMNLPQPLHQLFKKTKRSKLPLP